MKSLRSIEALETVLTDERALLYKHSTRCGLSNRARRQIHTFMENFPDATVYEIDVIADRAVSDAVEARLGVRHESPQVILVEVGEARHSAAHRRVDADMLATWWTSGGPASA